jgi:hypothetical protein
VPSDLQVNTYIFADLTSGDHSTSAKLGNRLCLQASKRSGTVAASRQGRREVPDNMVHEIVLHERTRRRWSTLHKQLDNAELTEFVQYQREFARAFEARLHASVARNRAEHDAQRFENLIIQSRR